MGIPSHYLVDRESPPAKISICKPAYNTYTFGTLFSVASIEPSNHLRGGSQKPTTNNRPKVSGCSRWNYVTT